jgi:hypothetical protein
MAREGYARLCRRMVLSVHAPDYFRVQVYRFKGKKWRIGK